MGKGADGAVSSQYFATILVQIEEKHMFLEIAVIKSFSKFLIFFGDLYVFKADVSVCRLGFWAWASSPRLFFFFNLLLLKQKGKWD